MNPSLDKIGQSGLYLTVFFTGAAVMVVELLGTRLIAPFYGASLYVWSSLISVTMIALSTGYFFGGRWADNSTKTGLSLIISLAALSILCIPFFNQKVLLLTDPMGLRAGAFCSALLLFSPCLTFLGMVSPFAIKLSTSQLSGVGSSAGSIYAVSTIGSVIGTLLLGFFLFPIIGSKQILIGVGLILLLLSLITALYEQKALGYPKAILISAVFLAVGILLTPALVSANRNTPVDERFHIRSEHESLYGWVRVIDEAGRDLRFLTSDASMIGAATLSGGASVMSYQTIVSLIPKLADNMRNGLIIGLGAGHMSSVLKNQYDINTDTLEIDPAVLNAAEQYFDYQATGKAYTGDARYLIRHLSGPYDLIIHDCFTGGTEPAHLMSKETLQQLKSLLSENGILAINFVSFYDQGNNAALASIAKTLAEVFPHQQVFISEPDDNFNDFIFLASSKAIDLADSRLSANELRWLSKRHLDIKTSHGTLLTDDYNALEHLQVKKSEYYRKVLIDMFSTDILLR